MTFFPVSKQTKI